MSAANHIPGRVEAGSGGESARRVLTRDEYIACIDTAYMMDALSGSEESEAIWRAAEAGAKRLGVSLDEHRHLREGDADCTDLIVMAWLAAPEGTDEERDLYRALELACKRTGTTVDAVRQALPRPHAIYVEGDL